MQSRQTKQEIVDENESYRSTLEQAVTLLSGALGYDEGAEFDDFEGDEGDEGEGEGDEGEDE